LKEKKQGKSIKKKLLSLIKYAFILITGFLLLISVLFQFTAVQTTGGRYLAGILTKKAHVRVSINTLNINVFKGFEIEGLVLSDSAGCPMIMAKSLKAKIKIWNIFQAKYHFGSVEMDSLDFRLIIHPQQRDYAFIQFINQLSSTNSLTTGTSAPFRLLIKNIDARHVHFQLKDENKDNHLPPHSMDYENLEVSDARIQVQNFHLIGDSLNFKVTHLSGKEKSGFQLNQFRADIVLSNRAFYFKNMNINTDHSRLALDYYMNANSWDSYNFFEDSVRLQAHIKPSELYMADLGYFASSLFMMKNILKITSGDLKGTVSDFTSQKLDIAYGKNTRWMGKMTLAGLPDFFTSNITADVDSLTTSIADLKSFYLPDDSLTHLPLPESLSPNDKLKLSGNFSGRLDNFKTQFNLIQGDKAKLEVQANYRAGKNPFKMINLQFEGIHFPLGQWLNQPEILGNGSFHGHLYSSDTLHPYSPVDVQLQIDHLYLNRYAYKDIRLDGSYHNDSLQTTFKIQDPHLDLSAQGLLALNRKSVSHLNFNIQNADFKKLNLWNSQDFHLKTKALISWKGFHPDSVIGTLNMQKTILQLDKDVYPMEQIVLKQWVDTNGVRQLKLQSDIMDLALQGNFRLAALGTDILQSVNHYFCFDPSLTETTFPNRHVQFRLTMHRPGIVGEHFIKGLSISPNTWLKGNFNFNKHHLKASGYAKKLQYYDIDLKQNTLHLSTSTDGMAFGYDVKHIILKDSTETDKSVFGLDSLTTSVHLNNDSVITSLFWDNRGSQRQNRGKLEALYVKQPQQEFFSLIKSAIIINDSLLQVDHRNRISSDSLGWKFSHFLIRSGKSELALEGRFPKKDGDSLNISFNTWNLSNLDLLWQSFGFDLSGIINGGITFTRANNRDARLANLSIKNLALNHSKMGDARILSTWDNVNSSIFLKSQIIRRGSSGTKKVFDLSGFYYPYRDTASLDMKLNFNHFNLKSINPFISEYVSKLEGTAEGQLDLKGTTTHPDITGQIRTKRSSLVVNYLNTKFSFNQTFVFRTDTIDFGKTILYDTLGNKGELSGYLLHHQLHNARLQLEVNTPGMLFFNTHRSQNDLYYGHGIASGKITITGPPDDINLNLDVATESGTSVILPLDYATEIPDKDYIVFKPPEIDTSQTQPTETILNLDQNRASQYAINLNMLVKPNAQLKIYLPSGIGNIESTGSGKLSLKTNSAGDLSLAGDYVVKQGAFNFTLANLVKKHFELVNGGRISWTGDPYKASVNLKGLYKVKVNLSSLGILIDSTTTFRNKVNVDCYVVMSKDLFNPDIRFEIKFPSLDPDMQRMIYAQMDTSNQAVMNQQMISLLVLGTFNFNNPEKASLASTSYNLLSNQLSSLLSKISKDFDIGFKYKPGDNLSQEEFEVALSTQLFDDRLIINGNFGMTYDKQSRAANNLIGDLDVGYKLTKDGSWMLKAYNHSNINSWYYYNNYDQVSPYTQGVGIAYQKEFNKLAELFSKKRKKRKTKKANSSNPRP
jgi:hypothetical protein